MKKKKIDSFQRFFVKRVTGENIARALLLIISYGVFRGGGVSGREGKPRRHQWKRRETAAAYQIKPEQSFRSRAHPSRPPSPHKEIRRRGYNDKVAHARPSLVYNNETSSPRTGAHAGTRITSNIHSSRCSESRPVRRTGSRPKTHPSVPPRRAVTGAQKHHRRHRPRLRGESVLLLL